MQRIIGVRGWSGAGPAGGMRRPGLWRRALHAAAVAAATLGALAVAKLATSPVVDLPADSGARWTAPLERMEEALARGDIGAAERAWHSAYLAALASRRWEGRVAVGDAYLRIGEIARAPQAAVERARTNYIAALSLARGRGSLDGALRVAEAFAGLGDREVAAACLRIAEALAAHEGDPAARDRVRAARDRLLPRLVEAPSAP